MPRLKDFLELHFIVFLWGFTAILGKLITIPSVELVSLRTSITALAIGAIIYKRGIPFWMGRVQALKLLGVGFIIAAVSIALPVVMMFHKSAIIHPSCKLGQDVYIGPNVVIEENVSLGDEVVIHAGSIVESDSAIGNASVIHPHVVIKANTIIGKNCILYAGCIIGSDGFGYAKDDSKWLAIPQIGRVILGDNVDIGSNSTIDRGALDDTIISSGVKIDNLVQIGHNCLIGENTIIAGCVGIAGSAKIGKNCAIGGAAMILGHLSITDNVTISPGSMITRSIKTSGTYTALMPFQDHETWLKTAAKIKRLK